MAVEGGVNSFTEQFLEFIQLLRKEGFKISISDITEALSALQNNLNLSDRTKVKYALSALLTGSYEEIKRFSYLFDLFFQSKDKRESTAAKIQQEKEDEAVIKAEQSLFNQTWSQASHSLFTKSQLLPTESIQIYVKLPPVLKKQIKLQLNRAAVRGQDLGVVSAEVIQFLQDWEEERLAKQVNAETKSIWAEISGEIAPAEYNLRNTDLGQLRDDDLEKMQRYLSDLAKKLAVLVSKRLKISARRKRLDLRRTIRKNLSYGGSIFQLVYQAEKINRPKVTLFCDVSGSMSTYSLFTLQFLYGLQQVIEKIESFLFGTDLEYLSHYFEDKSRDFQQTSRLIRENSMQWRGGTALGSSLSTFFRRYSDMVDQKTTVLLISDGATRDTEAAMVYLERLQEQCKSLIWLNPKPKAEWENSASKIFAQKFSMYECRSIKQLEEVISDIL
ncbi:MAG: VWA domain-containing protein [bacterium]